MCKNNKKKLRLVYFSCKYVKISTFISRIAKIFDGLIFNLKPTIATTTKMSAMRRFVCRQEKFGGGGHLTSIFTAWHLLFSSNDYLSFIRIQEKISDIPKLIFCHILYVSFTVL